MALLKGRYLYHILQKGVTHTSLRSISTSSVNGNAKKPIDKGDISHLERDEIFKSPEESKHDSALAGYITVDTAIDISAVSGVPDEHIKSRKVLIKVPTKNAMQSGTSNLHRWMISFDTRERWENHLMGWTSSGDPLSNMEVDFHSKEEAINFCEKNGWAWELQQPPQKTPMAKSYAANFSWDKRTRRSAK